MKKFNLKAFTLVEMLIVIVIIGILIAALLPRMQAAQGRARDVARKTALSQIQSAIVTHQGDHGSWPGCDNNGTCPAWEGTGVSAISKELIQAWMTDIPTDQLQWNDFKWLWTTSVEAKNWDYLYLVWTRNGTKKWGFILMAKTEVPGWSNWVVCDSTWYINSGHDLWRITPCTSLTKTASWTWCSNSGVWVTEKPNENACTYGELSQLRYIVLY